MRFVIVIPSFNQADFLPITVNSILSQDADVVLRIVDGGSTDSTLSYLRSIDDRRVVWTSEPDGGQSHAINRGMRWAIEHGADVLAWLNSDDFYLPKALATVGEALAAHTEASWVVGDCRIADVNGGRIRETIRRYKRYRLVRYTYAALLRECFLSQPAVFWRIDLERSVAYDGGRLLDESLHYAMDYDLWLRMGRLANPLIVDQQLAAFRVHGGSKTHTNHRAQFEEQYAVVQRYTEDLGVLRDQRRLIRRAMLGYRVLHCLGRRVGIGG